MAGTNIGTLAATITADAAGFLNSTKDVKKEAKSTADAMKSMATGGLSAFASFAGIPTDLKSVWSAFKDELAEVVELGKEATKTGLKTDTLIGLKGKGHDTEGMITGLRKFRSNLGAIHDEATDLASPFAVIGLSGGALKKLPMEEALGKTFDALNRLGNEFTGAKEKADLFGGKGYANMNRAIKEGGAGLQNAAKYAKDFGLSFSDEDLQSAKEFKYALRDIDNAFAGIRRQAALAFAPLITEGEALSDWLKGGTDLRDVFDAIARKAAEVAADIVAAFKDVKRLVDQINEAITVGKSPGNKEQGYHWDWGAIEDIQFNIFPGNQKPKQRGPVLGDDLEARLRRQAAGQKKTDPWEFFAPLRKLAKQADDDFAQVIASGRQLKAQLIEQGETFGMTGDQIAIYHLKLAGLPEPMAKVLEALSEQNRMMKEVSPDWEKAMQLIQDARSPVDAFADELDNMNRLLEEGIIDADVWAFGMKRATDQLAQFAHIQETKLPGYAVSGSKEAFDVIAKNEGTGKADTNELLKQANVIAAQQREEQKRTTGAVLGMKGADLKK